MRIVTESEVRKILDPARVIAALEDAFRNHSQTAIAPMRLQQSLGSNGILLLMPCSDPLYKAAGVKIVTVSDKPQPGPDRVHATYLLMSLDGVPELLIEAGCLTDIRTAATSALATKSLARKDLTTLGIFGTGRQARAHLTVFAQTFNFKVILVCGSSPQRSMEFARQMRAELGLHVEAVDAKNCAAASDVICTCTTARQPIFSGELLRPGTHLNVVGAFQPDAREVDELAVRRARVVVDTYDGALAEAGDLLIPLRSGAIRREHISSDLHELVSGKKPSRQNDEEVTLFKSVGSALEDLATAILIRDRIKN
jgi:ornithine cyclodeaminase